MKKLLAALGLAFCSNVCFAQAPATVTATVSLETTQALELRYDLPPGCTALRFANVGITAAAATSMRRDWTPIDDCGEIDSQGVRLKNAACSSVRFRVPAVERDLDRVYPWAHPLDRGIYSHTSAFAVEPGCGAMQWRFRAPGFVVVDGAPSGRLAERSQQHKRIDYVPVVLMEQEAGNAAGEQLHIDSRFSADAQAFLKDSMRSVSGFYAKAFPGLPFPRPYVVTVVSSTAGHWRGDVANRSTLRLMLGASPSHEEQADLRTFIAHEFAHQLQPVELNDRWKEEEALIKEGGAEFLGWLASAQLGWMDRASLGRVVDRALNRCLVAVGAKSWGKTANRHWGRAPYDCGMALHVLALAARPAKQPAALVLRDYYRSAEIGRQTDFARALECGEQAACEPKWLRRLLGSDEKFGAVIAEYGASTGLLTPAAAWPAEQIAAVAQSVLGALMASDCGGAVSIYRYPDKARIGSVGACKTLREGMVVVAAEGVPLFASRAGVAGLLEACRTGGKTTLGLQDGTQLALACDAQLGAPDALYTVDIDRLLERLGIKPPPA